MGGRSQSTQEATETGASWLNDGSCVRLRPTHGNHVWAYDFVADGTHDGRLLEMLTVIDEYSPGVLDDRCGATLTIG